MASNDPEKYIVDLNSMYKKYGVEEKADQARSYLLTQVTLEQIINIIFKQLQLILRLNVFKGYF